MTGSLVQDSLLRRLENPDPRRRAEACRAIARDPSAVIWIEALGERLGDPAAAVREAATAALVELGERHREVDEIVRASLRSCERERRFHAAQVAAALAPPTPRLIPALIDALASTVPGVAWRAARLLVDTGRLHADVLPILIGLARAGDAASSRRMAVFCLRELAPDDPRSAGAVVAASRDRDASVRHAALVALAGFEAGDEEVDGRLAEAAASEPESVGRTLASRALANRQGRVAAGAPPVPSPSGDES